MRRISGFTLVELLIVMAVIAVIAAIGMAGYRNARVSGNETSAVASLTALNQAQFAFAHTCGHGRYAPTLAALGTPMPSTGQSFLSADLTQSDPVTKSGYRIALTGTQDPDAKPACNGVVGLLQGYQATAEPVTVGVTGHRFFGTNTDRVVYADTVTYVSDMPETGAPGHGVEIK
jgi:type IV pilus assembly protein PilA